MAATGSVLPMRAVIKEVAEVASAAMASMPKTSEATLLKGPGTNMKLNTPTKPKPMTQSNIGVTKITQRRLPATENNRRVMRPHSDGVGTIVNDYNFQLWLY